MKTTENTVINFTPEHAEYQLILPLDIGRKIPEDDSVRLLSRIVETSDLKGLTSAYSPRGRNTKVPPRIMLKILLYAYMNGIYGSRAIETGCRRDINFMWLLEGYSAPDHNTIARFRTKRIKGRFEAIFSQFIMKLHDFSELPFENVFIDGTKIEANANKYSFVWKKTTEKLSGRLPEKVSALFENINKEYGSVFHLSEGADITAALHELLLFLTDKKEQDGIVFVSGTGKRKTELQRLTEKALELLEMKEKYTGYMKQFDGRNSFSKTDRDATFMHMAVTFTECKIRESLA